MGRQANAAQANLRLLFQMLAGVALLLFSIKNLISYLETRGSLTSLVALSALTLALLRKFHQWQAKTEQEALLLQHQAFAAEIDAVAWERSRQEPERRREPRPPGRPLTGESPLPARSAPLAPAPRAVARVAAEELPSAARPRSGGQTLPTAAAQAPRGQMATGVVAGGRAASGQAVAGHAVAGQAATGPAATSQAAAAPKKRKTKKKVEEAIVVEDEFEAEVVEDLEDFLQHSRLRQALKSTAEVIRESQRKQEEKRQHREELRQLELEERQRLDQLPEPPKSKGSSEGSLLRLPPPSSVLPPPQQPSARQRPQDTADGPQQEGQQRRGGGGGKGQGRGQPPAPVGPVAGEPRRQEEAAAPGREPGGQRAVGERKGRGRGEGGRRQGGGRGEARQWGGDEKSWEEYGTDEWQGADWAGGTVADDGEGASNPQEASSGWRVGGGGWWDGWNEWWGDTSWAGGGGRRDAPGGGGRGWGRGGGRARGGKGRRGGGGGAGGGEQRNGTGGEESWAEGEELEKERSGPPRLEAVEESSGLEPGQVEERSGATPRGRGGRRGAGRAGGGRGGQRGGGRGGGSAWWSEEQQQGSGQSGEGSTGTVTTPSKKWVPRVPEAVAAAAAEATTLGASAEAA